MSARAPIVMGALVALAALTLIAAGPWVVRQIRSLPAASLAARADQRIVTLEVGGMTCGGCAATVQSRLAQLDGVSAVEVRYPQRRAYVVCERTVPDSLLIGTVVRSGPAFLAQIVTR